MTERDLRLLEAKFDSATELSRYIIFAVQRGAYLKTDGGAVQRERFNAEHARSVHQGRRPIRIVAEISRNFFQCGKSASHHLVGRYDDVDECLRPIPAQISDLAEQSVGDGHHCASEISNHSPSQSKVLHAPRLATGLDQVANDELIFKHDEEAINQILHQILCAEPKSEAGDCC